MEKQLTKGVFKGFLTEREKCIIEFMAEGFSSKEIGLRLNISFKTVEVHRYRILKKANCANIAQLITKCFRAGFLK